MDKIYNRLGLTKDNGLYIIGKDDFNNLLPKRVDYILQEILNPESFYYFQNKYLYYFLILLHLKIFKKKKKLFLKTVGILMKHQLLY